MQSAKPFPVTTSLWEWLESRGEKVASLNNISGTLKGQMMAKAGRADELAKEIVELKRAAEAREAEFKSREVKREAEIKEERAERKALAERSETKIDKLEAKIEKLEAKLERLE